MVFEADDLSRKSLQINCEASHCSNYTLINEPISNFSFSKIIRDNTDIGFIKINIKGEEENIIKDVLTFSSKNKIPVYISFYVDLWEDKNINRFKIKTIQDLYKFINIIYIQFFRILFKVIVLMFFMRNTTFIILFRINL